MTEEQYLIMEAAAETKHEFLGGKVIDRAGASSEHAAIAMNFGSEIRQRLKGKPCAVHGSDLRVRVSESSNYYYPDLSVVCGQTEFAQPTRRTTLTNPRLIVEVTSPDSEADDRGRKFTDYRRMDSLQEYVLVSQLQAEVETFYRQPDGVWAIGPTISRLASTVRLRSLETEVPLSESYARIEFPPEPAKPDPAT